MANKCPNVGEGEFKLVLPLYDNKGRKIKSGEYNHYLKQMNSRFGGSSSNRIFGCYLDDKGERQCETNIVVTSVRDFDNPYDNLSKLSCKDRNKRLEEDNKFVVKLSREARKEFGQESVLSVWDKIQDATLVKGEKKEGLAEHKLKKISKKKIKIEQEIF